MTVLILAREFDPTADSVVVALTDRQVPVFRVDLCDFPRWLGLDAELQGGRWTGRLWNTYRGVELEDIRSIWYRNPSSYTFAPTMSPDEQAFAYREATLGLGGVLASLDVVWANQPNRCADAMYKPYQWALASRCGLQVADTAITNDPDAAQQFIADRRETTIIKALGPAGLTEDGEPKVAYTRRLTKDDVDHLAHVQLTATTLQRFVPKAYDVRLTVIGKQFFPVAIHAGTEAARTDWRSDPAALRYEVVAIPDDVAERVALYLAAANLVYAGLDFVVTPGGHWVLLEANSGPQFGWLQAATGLPMTAAMADLLAREDQ